MCKKAKNIIFIVLKINYLNEFCLMNYEHKITDIFCIVDEFCKEFTKSLEPNLIGNKLKRQKKCPPQRYCV